MALIRPAGVQRQLAKFPLAFRGLREAIMGEAAFETISAAAPVPPSLRPPGSASTLLWELIFCFNPIFEKAG